MTPDAFEQLVSEWLDRPDDAALRARIDELIVGNSAHRAVLEQWTRCDNALRLSMPATSTVDWNRLSVRIASAIDATVADAGSSESMLDSAFGQLPDTDARVDWSRFGQRVRASLDAAAPAPRVLRFKGLTAWVGAGSLAAAAAIAAFMVGYPGATPFTGAPRGVAVSRITSFAVPTGGFARGSVTTIPDASAESGANGLEPSGRDAAGVTVAEMYVAIDPVRSDVPPTDPIGFF